MTSRAPRRVAVLVSSLCAACASAGAPLADPITAGRPFVSTDAATPPARTFEFEAGVARDHERSSEVSAQLKYGAGERAQLAIGWTPWTHVELDGSDAFGSDNVEFSWKQRFVDAREGRPALGTELGLLLPTGSRGAELSSGEYDAFVALIASHYVDDWTFGAFYELAALGQPGAEHADATHTFTVTTVSPFVGRWAFLAELVHALVPEQSYDPSFLTLGATWNPDATWILDLACRAGLDDDAADWELTFGFTRGFAGP